MNLDTIVALATPPFKSALALIRVSGENAFDIVSLCSKKDIRTIKKSTIVYTQIVDEDNVLDDVVLFIYKGPKSFTGEDLVEISTHGSMLIVNSIIKLLISKGARYATNGEYSSRAFLNGKIDLIQAEAINDLINATTEEARYLSMLSLKGETSKIILPLKTSIADLLSLIEVNIDFPEYEDIEVANVNKIINDIDNINCLIDKLIKDAKKALLIKEGIKVAIVGKPNVGKSSLLNALIGEDKAIVTEIPGTTRDIVEGEINLNGLTLHLLDTAGIRNSKDKVEQIGINKAKESIKNADLVLCIVDGSKTLDHEDQKILSFIKDKNHLVVYNKSDLIKEKNSGLLYVSSINKSIEPLINKIRDIFGIDKELYKNPALNNFRQIGLLIKIKNDLEKAKIDAKNSLPVDLISVSLLSAYNGVLEILGEKNDKDLSKEIFSRFCVGK